jgi:rhodanese-related sulfurtransferase
LRIKRGFLVRSWSVAVIALAIALAFGGMASAQSTSRPPAGPGNACVPQQPANARANANRPVGLSSVMSGPTPESVPGATTVSPTQAACLYNVFKDALVVLDATQDDEGLPGAYRASWAAVGGSLSGDVQQVLEMQLRAVTGGDLDRPILVYCHHSECFLSYNVALRTVRAGYRKVYWMREGIWGWLSLGLPVQPVRFFAGMEPRGQAQLNAQRAEADAARRAQAEAARRADVAARLRGQFTVCDRSSRYQDPDNYSGLLSEAAFERSLAETIASERSCFQGIRSTAVANGATDVAGEIDALLANAPARLRAARDRGRIAFERNPVQYLGDDGGRLPERLRQKLAQASGPLTLGETCGTWSTAVPSMDKASIAAFNTRYASYAQCMNTWVEDRQSLAGGLPNAAAEMEISMGMLPGLRPYLCSTWARPNCVPDARWNALAAVATSQNLARLRAAAAKAENRIRIGNEVADKMRSTMEATNRAIEAYNASH